jgi:hypothetical protein
MVRHIRLYPPLALAFPASLSLHVSSHPLSPSSHSSYQIICSWRLFYMRARSFPRTRRRFVGRPQAFGSCVTRHYMVGRWDSHPYAWLNFRYVVAVLRLLIRHAKSSDSKPPTGTHAIALVKSSRLRGINALLLHWHPSSVSHPLACYRSLSTGRCDLGAVIPQ